MALPVSSIGVVLISVVLRWPMQPTARFCSLRMCWAGGRDE
jgi:hypothetical protein